MGSWLRENIGLPGSFFLYLFKMRIYRIEHASPDNPAIVVVPIVSCCIAGAHYQRHQTRITAHAHILCNIRSWNPVTCALDSSLCSSWSYVRLVSIAVIVFTLQPLSYRPMLLVIRAMCNTPAVPIRYKIRAVKKVRSHTKYPLYVVDRSCCSNWF